ncbi:hypothetical protein EBR43_05810 [bacterium]|nr:hypothetical protein [bacterium]
MNLNIETNFITGKKVINTMAVALNVHEVSKIAKSKGLEAANAALDKFVAKYVADFKKKLSASINQ